MKPTRYYSNKQEKQVAKVIGGKKVANSGATAFDKGDCSNDFILVECKTCIAEKKSFSIKKEWLEKNTVEAYSMNKKYSALAFNFGEDTDNYYVLDEYSFKKFLELLRAEAEADAESDISD